MGTHRAREARGDDVDWLGAGDVPRGEGPDDVPDGGVGEVSGMHSCCGAGMRGGSGVRGRGSVWEVAGSRVSSCNCLRRRFLRAFSG